MANEIRGVSNAGTLYARIMNSVGYWWNGTTFEAYSAANYADYDVAITEQGNSGVYLADFPTAIQTGGTYEYFIHKQAGASPTEGDIVVNTGKVDWSGTVAISSATGAMTGSEFYDYILRRGFKRTDKSTEVYEAITDAIQKLRRRFHFDEAEAEATSTDTISTLGDFKISQESDLGLLLGIVLEDGTEARPLNPISKAEFDERYPAINVDSDYGYPQDYCLYAGQVYIGPCPDSVSYVYRLSYSRRAGTVTSSTTGVPFTDLYRDVLADFVLEALYRDLDEDEKADRCMGRAEAELVNVIRRERINKGEVCFTQTPTTF
jgi:hypothetical protein